MMSLVDTLAMGLTPMDLGVSYTTIRPSYEVKMLAIENDDVYPDFECPVCNCSLPENWWAYTGHLMTGYFSTHNEAIHPAGREDYCYMDRDLLLARAVRRMFIRA